MTKPIVPIQWSVSGGPGFNSDHLWPLLGEPFCKNSKTDIAWLIALRGIKVCDSPHRWGYINSASRAIFTRPETIDHCFSLSHFPYLYLPAPALFSPAPVPYN